MQSLLTRNDVQYPISAQSLIGPLGRSRVSRAPSGQVSAGLETRATFETLPNIRLSEAAAGRPRLHLHHGKGRHDMQEGTVKWFSTERGYGFIQPSDGGRDVFVHITALQAAGLRNLNEGQKIRFELKTERGKTAAVNLEVS
jgi:cold shock protein